MCLLQHSERQVQPCVAGEPGRVVEGQVQACAYSHLQHVPVGGTDEPLPELTQAQELGQGARIQLVVLACSGDTLLALPKSHREQLMRYMVRSLQN